MERAVQTFKEGFKKMKEGSIETIEYCIEPEYLDSLWKFESPHTEANIIHNFSIAAVDVAELTTCTSMYFECVSIHTRYIFPCNGPA
jgi:hypothetical protein